MRHNKYDEEGIRGRRKELRKKVYNWTKPTMIRGFIYPLKITEYFLGTILRGG